MKTSTAFTAFAAITLAVSACQDITFARTNPYDLEAHPTIVVGAPDSLFTHGASFTATLTSDLPLPDRLADGSAATWTASAPLGSFFNGIFHVTDEVTVAPVSVTLTAEFGDRTVSKTVVVMQRPTMLILRCATFPCDTLRSFGEVDDRPLDGRDADQREIIDLAGLLAASTVLTRDPSVLTWEVGDQPHHIRTRAVANGTTWLVASYGGFADSAMVVVRQRLASWTNTCPETVAVGETVQLRTRLPLDARGNAMEAEFDGPLWRKADIAEDAATLTPAGDLTGASPGDIVVESFSPGTPHVAACVITVTPP